MEFYRIIISESYILRSSEPVTFDTLLNDFVGVYTDKNAIKDVEIFTSAAINSNKFVLESQLSPVTLQPLKYDALPESRYVKFLYKEKLIIYTDNNYDFIFSLDNGYVSITQFGNKDNVYYHGKDYKNRNKLLKLVNRLMPDLCGNPNEVNKEKLADKINRQISQKSDSEDKKKTVIPTDVPADIAISEKEEKLDEDGNPFQEIVDEIASEEENTDGENMQMQTN